MSRTKKTYAGKYISRPILNFTLLVHVVIFHYYIFLLGISAALCTCAANTFMIQFEVDIFTAVFGNRIGVLATLREI